MGKPRRKTGGSTEQQAHKGAQEDPLVAAKDAAQKAGEPMVEGGPLQDSTNLTTTTAAAAAGASADTARADEAVEDTGKPQAKKKKGGGKEKRAEEAGISSEAQGSRGGARRRRGEGKEEEAAGPGGGGVKSGGGVDVEAEGGGGRPSRTAISQAEQEKAAKASRSSRCYAPLPYQLKRLFFRPDPVDVKIAGRQLQVLHKDPHVYLIEDFLTESEYDYFEQLIEQQYGRFRASYTDEDVDSKVYQDDYRSSSFIPLRKGSDKAVRSIEARAAEIVGLPVECVEPLQMVGYRRNDRFGLHHDMGTYDDKTDQVDAVSPRRLVTFFLYLNNLPKGHGHTVFPQLRHAKAQHARSQAGMSVQPVRLRAVLWCNVREDGTPDPRLIHRADPVQEEGMLKFGVNIWLTDKNLMALALSSSGAVLNPNKVNPNKRTILSYLDEPCEVCHGRCDADKLLLCDHCDLGYHMACLDPPLKKVPTTAWMCPDCVGKRPHRGDYCEACEGGEHEHRMVLCDDCDRAYHTYCLEPKLRTVPKGDWYCPRCTRKREREEAEAEGGGGGAKRRRKKGKDKGEEESSSEEEEEEEEEPEGYEGCQGCKGKDRKDQLLLCDGHDCNREWHLGCLTPPLTDVPEGDWLCPGCVEAKLAEERRIEPGHWVLLLRADHHQQDQQEQEEEPKLAKVVQVCGEELRVLVAVQQEDGGKRRRSRQGLAFLWPYNNTNTANNSSSKGSGGDKKKKKSSSKQEEAAADEEEEEAVVTVPATRVLGKVRVEARGRGLVFLDTSCHQPLARQHFPQPVDPDDDD